MTTWAEFAEHVGSAAVYAAIAPAVVGGVMSIFKQWIPSEEQIAKKIDYAKSQLRTGLESSLRRVLNEYMAFEMQGEGASESDALPSYSKQQMMTARLVQCLETIHHRIASGYTVLLVTAIIGLMLILLALVLVVIRPYVTVLALLIVIIQVYFICQMFLAKRVLYNETRDFWN